MAEKLDMVLVEKPWGVRTLPAPFPASVTGSHAQPIGEIWFPAPAGRSMDLLVKYLFTRENLSIQVHPNNEQARARGFAGGKDECWYILDAEADAVVGIGTVRELDADALHMAALNGDLEQLMTWYPVQKGMLFHIPAGTIHCIGAGVSLIELQQNVDVTYRLYDFGRSRDLHLADGAAVSRAEPFAAHHIQHVEQGADRILLANDHFSLAQMSYGKGWPWDMVGVDGNFTRPKAAAQIALIPVAGELVADGVVVRAGECALVKPDCHLTMTQDAHILVAWSAADAERVGA
jgi:mannose-6-phosphate isomerase